MRPLQNPTFCPISASSSNFNPRNTQCVPVVKIIVFLELEPQLNLIPVVKIIVFLELEQKSVFFKGLLMR